MAGAHLLREPVAGFGFAVAQEHGAGPDLADEIEQFAAIGGGGQVGVLHFTAFGDFAGTAAHDERSARPGSLEPSAGRVSGGVADEENGLALVADHAGGEVVGGGVFAHHAGSEDKNASAGEAHLLQLSGFKNDQVECLSQLEVAVVAVGAVRFEVVDFREDAPQAANIDRLPFQLPAFMSKASRARISCVRPSAKVGMSTQPLRLRTRSSAAVSRWISFSREKPGGTSRLPRVVSMM